MAKKKTTLMIDEGLYSAIRIEAAKRRRSVSDFVAEATRAYLAAPERPRKKTVLPTIKGEVPKYPPHVNPHSTSDVLEYLDSLEDPGHKHGTIW